ncbi:ABC transporter ATP-binding protein [Candidatus Anaplasma sp. TIGMIC]|uniref:ABC transporter ATP-binding protein n=1 Tax=Candidatus Anaplasma sp. TIGMIC TaxID=3020713 RepID=UPI00232E1790|nr:ATP-binding cassette domain-containing protein [Candidatus Anaplasma sp. TIGMIC]MDB1135139.1 ATP-binding cassette domain-containing protein [Candidatus Anaplasma sp. TIGMIC]
MRILLSYIKPYKRYFLFAYLVVLVTSGAILAFGKGLSAIVDTGLFGNASASLGTFFWVLLLIFIIAKGSFLRIWLCGKGASCVVRDLRHKLYDKIVSLSPAELESFSTSLLMTRLMADTAALGAVLNGSVLVIFRNITVLASSMVMLVHTNFQLTSRIALVLPVLLIIVAFLGKRVKRSGLLLRKQTDELAHFGEETCSMTWEIQSLSAEEIVRKKFACLLESVAKAEGKHVILRAFLVTLIIASVTTSVGLVLWVGIRAVAEHSMSAGTLLSFIFYSALAAGAVNGLGDNIHDLQKAVGITEDITKLLNVDPCIADSAGCVDVFKVEESVSINDVTFAYTNRAEPVLKGVSLSMKKGEKIAFVGYSGTGKSTIVDLLLRYYDVSTGSITIDGVDIRNISLKSLRSFFCVVPQCPAIFSGTILENLTYGLQDYTEEQLRDAVEGANIADFIFGLPEKFDTFVGEKGIFMSEGQKQRIVLARAILRRPEVLILDEATSALDANSESKVYDTLRELMKDKLTITIAHRLATVVDSDKIVVLNNGVIQEVGTHDELMADDNSLYAGLFKLQHKVGMVGAGA